MKYNVLISFPDLGDGYFTSTLDAINPYEAAEKSINNWQEFPVIPNKTFSEIKLTDVVPIHNADGIRDITQISSMENELVLGKEILHENGLPNCKLVLLPSQKLLLFDGHHTILAYLSSGKKTLKEVPHMVITLEKSRPVESKDVATFFPKADQSKVEDEWSKYVVNWQAEVPNQLELREVQTIGDLVTSLGDRNKAASQ